MGKAKQQSGDPQTRNEGRADQAKGKVDQAKGELKGKMGNDV